MGFMGFFKSARNVQPDEALRRIPVPPRIRLPFSRPGARAARPRVVVGQHVRKGECIAQDEHRAAIHASTSGTVTAIGEIGMNGPSGLPILAVTIDSDGEDRWIDTSPLANPFALAPAELARQLTAAGIAGLDGRPCPPVAAAGSPVVPLRLLIEGREGEARLSCAERLMCEVPEAIVEGIRLLLHATGAAEARVNIEDCRSEAIALMREAAAPHSAIRIRAVAAGSPRDIDEAAIVHDVGSAFATRQAIFLGRPQVSRLITLHGDAIANPGNYEVLFGTLVSDLIAFSGGYKANAARLFMGGPLMGTLIPHAHVPVARNTSGILAFTADR